MSKIDLEFISYGATQDAIGLHSKLVGVLQVSDINKNKKFYNPHQARCTRF